MIIHWSTRLTRPHSGNLVWYMRPEDTKMTLGLRSLVALRLRLVCIEKSNADISKTEIMTQPCTEDTSKPNIKERRDTPPSVAHLKRLRDPVAPAQQVAGEGVLEALRGASQLLVQRAGVADQAIDAIWFSAVSGWPFRVTSEYRELEVSVFCSSKESQHRIHSGTNEMGPQNATIELQPFSRAPTCALYLSPGEACRRPASSRISAALSR